MGKGCAMKRLTIGLFALAASALFVLTAASQPPDGKGKGPPGGRPGPFELAKARVLPPFVFAALTLTPDQERQVADLEKEVRERLDKILTAEQKQQIEGLQPRGP